MPLSQPRVNFLKDRSSSNSDPPPRRRHRSHEPLPVSQLPSSHQALFLAFISRALASCVGNLNPNSTKTLSNNYFFHMKTLFILLSAVSLLGMSSCSSTTASGAASAAPSDARSFVLHKTVPEAQKAAVSALSQFDCEIEAQTPNYVQGFRRRHIGLVLGSGGETLKVWLESISQAQTRVKVKTEKSLVGIAGQKNWDEKLSAAMGGNIAN